MHQEVFYQDFDDVRIIMTNCQQVIGLYQMLRFSFGVTRNKFHNYFAKKIQNYEGSEYKYKRIESHGGPESLT